MSVSNSEKKERPASRVILIGDLHGNINELKSLWSVLEQKYGEELDEAAVVFLGDYVDRGPDSNAVIQWLVDFKARRSSHNTGFIAGNHDFSFAAFLGGKESLPVDNYDALDHFDVSSKPGAKWYTKSKESQFWKCAVTDEPKGLHWAGRRWAGDYAYDAETTFNSYGVEMKLHDPQLRDNLKAAVPFSHKKFLSELSWIYEQPVQFKSEEIKSIMCVHAGIHASRELQPQLKALRARDPTAEILLSTCFIKGENVIRNNRISPFSDRMPMVAMHPDFDGTTIVASGHHGQYYCNDQKMPTRIIVDRNGGNVAHGPLEAVVLPERIVVRHTGEIVDMASVPLGEYEEF